MAYQSIHTGQAIDEGISINSTQNEKISNLESKNTELNNKISGLENNLSAVYLKIYSVGCIYMSTNSTSPASLFGGTWEQLKDRFLLGAGDSYNSGDAGGEAEHTLIINEMPNHNHQEFLHFQSGGDASMYAYYSYYNYGGGEAYSGITSSTGGGQAHNNMPPYLVVYMWKRVA